MEKIKSHRSVARTVLSLPFFCIGAWLGVGTAQHLWVLYCEPSASFGLVFNFGLFEVNEPWSSCFALVCATSFLWAGCSLLRKRGGIRLGAIVGTVCFVLFAVGFFGAW
jgi:hypothetical protein